MMSDKLKDFIDNNRDAFDSESPDPGLYNSLQMQVAGNGLRKTGFRKIVRRGVAAASVILVGLSMYFIFQKKHDKPGESPAAKTDAIIGPDPTYAKEINQYQQLIDHQQAQLKQVKDEHPELYRQFTDDINQLDSAYRVLKITLESNPNTEQLLDAMVHNLQIQTELLNRQLSVIKEIKQKSKT